MTENKTYEELRRDSAKGILFCLITQSIWGFSILAAKHAVSNYTAWTFLSWRFTTGLVGFLVLIALGFIKLDLKGKRLLPLFALSVMQSVCYFIGETFGVMRTTASESGLFLAMVPIVTLIFSALFLKRMPTRVQSAGIVISVLGIVIIESFKATGASYSIVGYAFLIFAVVSTAAFCILSDKYREYTSAEKAFAMTLTGALFFDACALWEHGQNGSIGYLVTLPFKELSFALISLYLGVGCTIIANICINAAIRYIGGARTSSFASITTVMTILCGVLILGERLTAVQVAGIVLVLTGITMANKLPKEDKIK